jgi:solute carrier family 25 citrate transporter 1
MLSGSLGGLLEACLCQPLDVAKTRLQLDAQKKYKGLAHCISTIYREEGARALYKGLTPFCTHLTLKYALRLGSFGFIRNMLGGKAKDSARNTLVAGLAAGALEAVVIVTPFEVIKTRLQKQKGTNRAVLKYKNPIHCASTIMREEGIRSLWKGVSATVIRQASNQGTSFLAVQLINKHAWGKVEGDGTRLPLFKTLVTGFVAGAVGPLCNQPFDVAKSRLMAQEQTGVQRVYTSTMQCMTSVYRQEGFQSLYRGIIPRLARVASGQAIMWSVVLRIESFF